MATDSPLQRLVQLEQLAATMVYPALARLTHESRVQGRIIQLLMSGHVPTLAEVDIIIDQEIEQVGQGFPGVKIQRARNVATLYTPGGVVHVNQDPENGHRGG